MAPPDDTAPPLPPNANIDALVLRDQVLGLYAQERRSRPIGWALLAGMVLVFGQRAGALRAGAWCALIAAALALSVWRQRAFAQAVADGS